MKPITKAQRAAIKRIFDRGPIYSNNLVASVIAANAGWHYLSVDMLPKGGLRERVMEAGYTHVWVHGTYTPVYEDASSIVRDYALAKTLTYREFRCTVKTGYDCLIVQWRGMTLGIESDGYTHS